MAAQSLTNYANRVTDCEKVKPIVDEKAVSGQIQIRLFRLLIFSRNRHCLIGPIGHLIHRFFIWPQKHPRVNPACYYNSLAFGFNRMIRPCEQPWAPHGAMGKLKASKQIKAHKAADVWASQTRLIASTSALSVLNHTKCVRACTD
jgi:hypothetical protein